MAAACWGSSSAQATDGERVAGLGSQGLPQASSLEQCCLKDACKKLLLPFTLVYHSSKDSIYFLLGEQNSARHDLESKVELPR